MDGMRCSGADGVAGRDPPVDGLRRALVLVRAVPGLKIRTWGTRLKPTFFAAFAARLKRLRKKAESSGKGIACASVPQGLKPSVILGHLRHD